MTQPIRLKHLDGIRGLAILMVVVYHAYYRWSDILPYGNQYQSIWIFKYGFLGVELFFMLSGYVILMSLDACKNFSQFLLNRWIRLFPAMLIVSFIVLSTSSFFPERPAGSATLWQTIPGLTFIDPKILQRIFNIPFNLLEGSFWSIFVETKFYVFAGSIYFFVSKRYIPYTLLLPLFFHHLIHQCNESSIIIRKLQTTSMLFSFEYFGWFSIGSALYLYQKYEDRQWLVFSFITSIITSYLFYDSNFVLPSLIVAFFFISCTIFSRIQSVLSNSFLLITGLISYPLYLIHENLMVAIIIKSAEAFPIPSLLLPVFPFFIISLISYFIVFYWEKPIQKRIKMYLFIK